MANGKRIATEQLVSERGKASVVAPNLKRGAETRENQVQASSNRQAHVTDEYVLSLACPINCKETCAANIRYRGFTPTPEIAPEPDLSEPVNEIDALEARRKRREAIRAKHRSQATPLHLKALNVGDGDTDSSATGTEPSSAKESSGGFVLGQHDLTATKLTIFERNRFSASIPL